MERGKGAHDVLDDSISEVTIPFVFTIVAEWKHGDRGPPTHEVDRARCGRVGASAWRETLDRRRRGDKPAVPVPTPAFGCASEPCQIAGAGGRHVWALGGRAIDEVGRLLGGPQPMFGNPRADSVAGDPQDDGGPSDVPASLGKHAGQVLTFPFCGIQPGPGLSLWHVRRLVELQGQSTGRDQGIRTQERYTLHQAIELSHITWPMIGPHYREGLGTQSFERDSVLRARLGNSMLGQELDVVPTLTERRNPQSDDGEPMVEVLPEAMSAHQRGKVRVRRADERHVNGFASRGPQPPYGAILQNLQQLGLKSRREQAHLVEEERAPIRHLEESRLRLSGIRKRSPLIPEQLRLEQVLRESGAVQLDELPAGPRPGPVDDIGEQAFAGTGFPGDQKGRVPVKAGFSGYKGANLIAKNRDLRGAAEQFMTGIHRHLFLNHLASRRRHGSSLRPVPARIAKVTG